jgi:hypothetical protein
MPVLKFYLLDLLNFIKNYKEGHSHFTNRESEAYRKYVIFLNHTVE